MGDARILICDDEPTLRELMRVALEGDYSFAEAADTAEAVEVAERFRPDLIVLDVMMPGGSGLDVIEHLRRDPALRETPVLVVSALSAEDDRDAAREAGADAFMGKPFDPDELSARVEELLAARQ